MIKPVPDEGDFYEVTKNAISIGRHASYVKNVVEEYEDYKKYFENVFIAKPLGNFYKFHVDYLLKRPVWRTIIIREDQKFVDLAMGILDAMDWVEDHMHGFNFPMIRGKLFDWAASPYSIFAPDWEDDPFPTYKTNQIKVGEINFEKYPKLRFCFDYGIGHDFDVLYKGITKLPRGVSMKNLPVVIDQRGIAPDQSEYPR